MRVTTILNRIEKQPGFVYEPARWSENGDGIEVPVRPAARNQRRRHVSLREVWCGGEFPQVPSVFICVHRWCPLSVRAHLYGDRVRRNVDSACTGLVSPD